MTHFLDMMYVYTSIISRNLVQSVVYTHADIPASVQPVLLEALEAWRRAESKKESDITLAKMSYSRAASEWVNVLVTY